MKAALLSLACVVSAGSAFGSGAQFKFDEAFAMPIVCGIAMVLLWLAAVVGVAAGLMIRLGRVGLSVLGALAVLVPFYSVLTYQLNDHVAVDVMRLQKIAMWAGLLVAFFGTAMGRLGDRFRWRSLPIALGTCVCVVALTIGAIALTGSRSMSGPFYKSPLLSMSPLGLAFLGCVVYTLWPGSNGKRRKTTVKEEAFNHEVRG